MKCLKCGKESKREFCRECKNKKHNASAILSQNRNKLIKLLNSERLSPEWFDKFILYTNNILKYWKIYMEYKDVKRDKNFRWIIWSVYIISGCIVLRSVISLVIIHI